MTERQWRDAKPKWVVDAAEAEIADMKRRLALRWPDEARPVPVEFQWTEYDRLIGSPVPGEYFYYSYDGHVYPLRIRQKNADETGWKEWRFAGKADHWSDSVTRGPLYKSEREALLAGLWAACDRAATELEKLWTKFIADRGFV